MTHGDINRQFANLSQRQAHAAAKLAANKAYEAAIKNTQQRAKDQGYVTPSWTLKGNPYPLY